jgi:hypothetical protein
MLIAQKPLISLDFISVAPQFPENLTGICKIEPDLPFFGLPRRSIA